MWKAITETNWRMYREQMYNVHYENLYFPTKLPQNTKNMHIFCIYSAWLAFSALTLLVGHQEEHPACKNWLKRGADCLHMVQLMPLTSQNPIISCLISIQTGFTFLILAYPGCPGKEAVRWVHVVSCRRQMQRSFIVCWLWRGQALVVINRLGMYPHPIAVRQPRQHPTHRQHAGI